MSLPVFEGHAWDWLDADGETIAVLRAGLRVGPSRGGYDPAKDQLYLDACADVRAGDVVQVRGQSRRVVDVPEVWRGAGTVVQLAELAAFLDAGELVRPAAGPGRWDYSTNAYVAATDLVVWSGACTITSVDTGVEADVAEQMVTTQTLEVETPVGLVDVKPGDVFRATSSADPRLVGRRLVVTRVQADSAGAVRVIRVIDNQG